MTWVGLALLALAGFLLGGTAWSDAEPVWTPVPTARHQEALGECLAQSGLRANDVPDAHLAALAVEHGLRLATSDSGFARFAGLEWFNPLQPA